MIGKVKLDKRADWFVWHDPDPQWCAQHAEVPGLRWAGDGSRVTMVWFHRSHAVLLPSNVSIPMPFGCHFADGAEYNLQTKGITLRSYQAEDLPFLTSRRSTLLAYEMRLGKTLTACAAHDPSLGPLVVVGPLAARDVWRQWIERVHGHTPIMLAGRSVDVDDVATVKGFPSYFVHYDVLEAWTGLFSMGRIGTLVLDEVHYLQNRKAKRTAAAHVLAATAERIIGLSGTPQWSNPDSLWSILHVIAPGAWGGHFEFAKRYAGAMPTAHGWIYKGSSNEDEMRERLAEMMVRRTWKDVLGQLPPVQRVVEPVDVPVVKKAALEAEAHKIVLAHGTNTVAGYLSTLRRKLSELKIAPAVEAAKQAMADGHKVTLWTWHTEVAAKLQKELAKHCTVYRLSADMDADTREAQVNGFRAHAGTCAMITGITVGGTAIDLSCSDYAIFVELDWIPANVYQAEMRTFHPSRPHVVVYLYADVPIEKKLVEGLGVREGFQTSLGMGFDEIAKMVLSVTDDGGPSVYYPSSSP